MEIVAETTELRTQPKTGDWVSLDTKRLRIGFDCDGVLTDFYSAFVQLIRDIHGIDVPNFQPNTWNWVREYLTRKQEDVVWRELCKSKTFWRDLPICPKVYLEDLRRIKELCNTDDVFFITNTVSADIHQAAVQRIDWLAEHCDLDKSKYTLAVIEKKIDYINSIGLGFYTDDKPAFLEKANEQCKNTIIVKMNWAYNKDVKALGVDSVADYLDLIDKVKRIRS